LVITINLAKSLFELVINNATVPWPKRNKEYYYAIEKERERFPPEFECLFDSMSEDNDFVFHFDKKNMEHIQKWKKVAADAKGKSNVLGHLLYLQSFSNFDLFYRRSVELRTKCNITRIQIALNIFKNKFDRYPKSLDELVENKILIQIPLDLFSNRPLNYTSNDCKLWSIGYNEVNDNADIKKDIVFSCSLSGQPKDIKHCN
jgi:hypothetical protein